MPNHVTNNIRISLIGVSSDEFINKIKGENDVIDFEAIIPQPESVLESLDRDHRDGRRQPPDWYEWRREHWGTKWNAYDQSLVQTLDGDNSAEIEIQFDTAWAPPLPIIRALREWPEVEWIGGNWVEEFCESAGVF